MFEVEIRHLERHFWGKKMYNRGSFFLYCVLNAFLYTVHCCFVIVYVVTGIIYRNIRVKGVSKYHILLCVALLLMYVTTLILVTLSAEKASTIYGGCVSLSLLVHYFTLVAVMWMGAEALLMFQKVVIILSEVQQNSSSLSH